MTQMVVITYVNKNNEKKKLKEKEKGARCKVHVYNGG